MAALSPTSDRGVWGDQAARGWEGVGAGAEVKKKSGKKKAESW